MLEGPNADLRNKRELIGAVCCGGTTRYSGQIRLMQRPELVRMRRSATAAAAELERQRDSERKKTTEGGEWGRPRSCLFIRKG